MPSVVNLPRAPQTGLGRLGDVIYASAAEYAGNRRADDREARLRAQRLADVESDRGYQRTEGDRQYDRGRTDRLADTELERQNRLTDEQTRIRLQMLNSLVPRYLSPDQLNDAGAVAAAFERAKRDGMIASDPLVKAAMEVGAVTMMDLENPEALVAKLAMFSGRLADRTRLADAQPEQAGTIIAQKEEQLSALRQRAGKLEQVLGSQEPRPDPVAVQNLARQIALASNPKASSADIANAMGEAQRQLSSDMFVRWNQARQDALIQRQLLEAEGRQLSAEVNTLRGTFRVVGGLPGGAQQTPTQGTQLTEPMGSVGPTGPMPTAPTLQQAQQNIRAGLAPVPQAAPMGGASGTFSAPAPTPATAPVSRLAEPQFVPTPTAPPQRSNMDRMRNMEPGYNPLTMLTGNTPDRQAELAGLNEQRRAWDAAGGVMGAVDPEVEAATLRARLERIADKTSVDAQTIVNRLRQLEQRLAQKMTRSAQLIDPVSTAFETVPQRSVGRLTGPEF